VGRQLTERCALAIQWVRGCQRRHNGAGNDDIGVLQLLVGALHNAQCGQAIDVQPVDLGVVGQFLGGKCIQ